MRVSEWVSVCVCQSVYVWLCLCENVQNLHAHACRYIFTYEPARTRSFRLYMLDSVCVCESECVSVYAFWVSLYVSQQRFGDNIARAIKHIDDASSIRFFRLFASICKMIFEYSCLFAMMHFQNAHIVREHAWHIKNRLIVIKFFAQREFAVTEWANERIQWLCWRVYERTREKEREE